MIAKTTSFRHFHGLGIRDVVNSSQRHHSLSVMKKAAKYADQLPAAAGAGPASCIVVSQNRLTR
jgi:hypothetical protein